MPDSQRRYKHPALKSHIGQTHSMRTTLRGTVSNHALSTQSLDK